MEHKYTEADVTHFNALKLKFEAEAVHTPLYRTATFWLTLFAAVGTLGGIMGQYFVSSARYDQADLAAKAAELSADRAEFKRLRADEESKKAEEKSQKAEEKLEKLKLETASVQADHDALAEREVKLKAQNDELEKTRVARAAQLKKLEDAVKGLQDEKIDIAKRLQRVKDEFGQFETAQSAVMVRVTDQSALLSKPLPSFNPKK